MTYSKEWERYCELLSQRPEEFRNNGPLKIVTDWSIVEKYQKDTGKVIGVRYESAYNILVVDLVYEQEGKYFPYERVLPAVRRGAVVCIPEYQGQYILLKQYRHALRDYQYAFPRGYAEEGISGAENACKEIVEELDAKVEKAEFLGNVVADSGLSGNVVEIYICHINSYRTKKDYEGIVGTHMVSADEFKRMIRENEISDGFTLAAWSYL